MIHGRVRLLRDDGIGVTLGVTEHVRTPKEWGAIAREILAVAGGRERAMQINDRLVNAWLIRNGLKEEPIPSFADFSLAEAVAASRVAAAHPGERQPNGMTAHHCFIAEGQIQSLYIWALKHGASVAA